MLQIPITEALHIVTVQLRRKVFDSRHRIMLTVKKLILRFLKGGEIGQSRSIENAKQKVGANIKTTNQTI